MSKHLAKSFTAQSERDILTNKYKNARNVLLWVSVFTLCNVLFAAFGGDTYLLFSATIPYIITLIASLMCGVYPAEYTEEILGSAETLPMPVLYVVLAIALAMIGLYVLAYFRSSKNRAGWLIFALVLFILDTLFMLLYAGISLDWITDYIFHALILVSLISGLRTHAKLKRLPASETESTPILLENENGDTFVFEAESTKTEGEDDFGEPTDVQDSLPLRQANMSVKYKTLLEATVNGKVVLYRRVQRTNELVIDGQVYDEYIALMEKPHTLSAFLGGHLYEAGITAASKSFIALDGEPVKSKLRLI